MAARIPRRLAWAVETLDLQPNDHVLEIGCGHGIAVALICQTLAGGKVTAIDRSAKMIEIARKRNEPCIAQGKAEFHTAALDQLDLGGECFDRIFAVNVNVFWLEPAEELRAVRRLLAVHGALYLFYEPAPAKVPHLIADMVTVTLQQHGFAAREPVFNGDLVCVIASAR